MDNNNKNSFEYTYSAPEQAEIKRIRQKYVSNKENKIEQLRRLDRMATEKGAVVSLVFGILGILLLGIGMSLVLVFQELYFIPGVILGVIGLVGIILAYPMYTHIIRKERERIAPEIIRLTDELLK